jgi:hypothetical protein
MYKLIINICDIQKPTVFTCKEDKTVLISKIEDFLNNDSTYLSFDSGDIFFCKNKSNIRSILITENR